jgi:multicopper oxidase
MIDRRGFLMLSGAAVATAAAGCSSATRPAPPPAPPPPALEVAFTPTETDVDLGGPVVRTWAYTDRLPGNEIRLRKGQRMRATVNNRLPAETSIHWHGLAIPNAMDGVPPLTQAAIPAGGGFTYDFVVPDAGTYWYHSHVGTQADRGLYGALIVEDPAEKVDYDDELVLVLDDWLDGTGTNPDAVLATLRTTGMTGMGMGGAGVSPTTPLGTDGGDVTYPHFLVNGRVPADPDVRDYRAGQRIRLRVVNAASDTAFRVAAPGTRLNVISTDGYPVMPAQTDSVILGMGERVDATFTVDASMPIVAVPEGRRAARRSTSASQASRARCASTNSSSRSATSHRSTRRPCHRRRK